MIAKILVDVPAKAVDRLFDYAVPAVFEDVLEVGMRVVVPFGPREAMGFCLEISEVSEYPRELKPVSLVLDIEPYLTQELIDLAKRIAIDTASTLIRTLETMLPAALKAVYTPKFTLLNEVRLPASLKPLFAGRSEILMDSALAPYAADIKKAVRLDAIRQGYDIKSKSVARHVRCVRLVDADHVAKTEKHLAVIEKLKASDDRTMVLSELLETLGLTESVVRTLEKKNVVSIFDREVYRDVPTLRPESDKRVILSPRQQAVRDSIVAALDTGRTFLLHGVTGSGKTEVYLSVIEEVLARQREVIFLVPEIALTPMMVSRFRGRFHDRVAILHSRLSIGEKYDEWRRIIRGEASVVVGARSAVFAPFANLGMIIVDECHETTYKQDDMPKYYALDVATRRAEANRATVVLGSATPNIETYARAKRGYFDLLELPERAMNASMPDVEVVDMKAEFKRGNPSSFSEALKAEITLRLERREQTILLLNRRGYHTFVLCRDCGHVIGCPNCDISLTYHETDHSLRCHYCGHRQDVVRTCPKCGSDALQYMGAGTQKIEAELRELFPSAKVVRMDIDTTRVKNGHERLLNEFEETGDILLGTQMIAKGLDYPRVTLVGIIQADGSLYRPDFRAPEKTFQLIMQVSGRSGRSDLSGKVVVQAFNPNHYAIRYAVQNDYLGFYHYEMSLRKLAKYVPFYFLAEIVLSGENVRDIFLRGKDIAKTLRLKLTQEAIVLGPVLPQVARIRNRYSCQILVKYRQEPALDELLYQIIDEHAVEGIFVNVDKSPM
jgi:primosomal protein N' (replication factor Y)